MRQTVAKQESCKKLKCRGLLRRRGVRHEAGDLTGHGDMLSCPSIDDGRLLCKVMLTNKLSHMLLLPPMYDMSYVIVTGYCQLMIYGTE